MSMERSNSNLELVFDNIFSVLVRNKLLIIGFLVGSILIGFLFSMTIPKTYKVSVQLVPEYGNTGIGNGALGGLLSLGGLSGSTKDVISITPDIYPNIINSTPFCLSVLEMESYVSNRDTTVTYRFFSSNLKEAPLFNKIVGFPFRLIKSLLVFEGTNSQVYSMTGDEAKFIDISLEDELLMSGLRSEIDVKVESGTGVVILDFVTQDPYLTASVAQFSVDYIMGYVTQYSISKAEKNLEFIKNQMIFAEENFEQAQLRLAHFKDSNKNVQSAVSAIQEQKLQSEYSIAFQSYNSLVSSYEQAKIDVERRTPVFTVIEPVKLPKSKYGPKRSMIMMAFLLVGIFGLILILAYKEKHIIFR